MKRIVYYGVTAAMMAMLLSSCHKTSDEGLAEAAMRTSASAEETAAEQTKADLIEETEEETETESETEEWIDPRLDVLNHYQNLGVVRGVSDHLNVRDRPEMNGMIIGKLLPYNGVEILENLGTGWYHIHSGDLDGFVSGEYIADGQEAANLAVEHCREFVSVQADVLHVRTGPGTEYEIWLDITSGEMQPVSGKEGEWYCLNINNTIGYVHQDYVQECYYLDSGFAWSPMADVSATRQALINYGMQFLGVPYVWGGNDLASGVDCSGFTRGVMASVGISLPRTSREQVNYGTPVASMAEARPGDLLFYADANGTIDHVVIYIGDNKILQAAMSIGCVNVTHYNYNSYPVAIRNVVGD
ncbi:MAG: C40 family peptidase [Lachnospiraceae bacterium]|nr:C40 family peptidase [Lachnospiraceae bacterium]